MMLIRAMQGSIGTLLPAIASHEPRTSNKPSQRCGSRASNLPLDTFSFPHVFKKHTLLGGSIHVRARFFCLPRHLHVLVAHPVPQMKARNQRPTKGPKFLQNPGVAQRNARDQEQHQEEVKDLARSAQILAQKAKQYERMQAAALGGASESESARWSPPTGICRFTLASLRPLCEASPRCPLEAVACNLPFMLMRACYC